MWSKLLRRPGFWVSLGCLVVLAVAAVLLLTWLLPYHRAQNTMDPQGCFTLTVTDQEDQLLQWPQGTNAQGYHLQILQDDQILCDIQVTGQCHWVLPQLPQDVPLRFRVSSFCCYGDRQRPGDQVLEASFCLREPSLTQLQWQAEPDTGRLTLALPQVENEHYQIYRLTPEPVLIADSQTPVSFLYGDGGDFPLPEHGAPEILAVSVRRTLPQLTYQGRCLYQCQVDRQAFLGNRLQLQCQPLEENAYTLSWNETKADAYVLQLSTDGQQWQTLATVPKDGQRSYTTDHLLPFAQYQFRLTAQGYEQQVTPDQLTLTTAQRALYSTIWPLMDLTVWSSPQGGQTLGTATAGTAFCVVEVCQDRFGVRFGDTTGYVDSCYCMINLPEYIGQLCAYDITNSYSSLYMVHDYPIEAVTGTVITGYERVRLGRDQYLVPLLYPTAQKLIPAAQEAIRRGYRLKIYDAFRPRQATLNIYELTQQLLDRPVPAQTHDGQPPRDMDQLHFTPVQQDPEQPWEGLMEGLTYEILMTDNSRYSLANFLALGVSNHNLGIAMDMTLQTLEGQELSMQTAIHDLSWFSEPPRNNQNADLLKEIMTEAGFGMIKAEWWHFQDDVLKAQLELKNLHTGVNPGCWMLDDRGWRYRGRNGQYLTGCTQTLEGEAYTFDQDGYLQP